MSQTKAQLIDAVDGSIVTADIADDAVNADKLASNSVVSASIVDGSIVNADINASAAIAGSKIADFVSNNTNNQVLTATGTANSLNGEANLTFDGDDLLIKSSTDGRRISFAGDGTSHYMKYDNTLSGIILNGYGGIAFESNGTNERMRIDSSGRLLLGTTTEGNGDADEFTIANVGGGNMGMTIRSATSALGNIFFSDGTSGDSEYRGMVQYGHNNDSMRFSTAATERMRINSAGQLLSGTTSTNSSDTNAVFAGGGNAGTNNYGKIYLSAAETNPAAGTALSFIGTSTNNVSNNAMAFIGVHSDGQHASNDYPTRFGFFVTADGASSATERLRIHNSGEVTIAAGVTLGTAITSNAASNTLDDYEEGTWTPGGSWDNVAGVYTKIGRVVHAAFQVRVDTTGSANISLTNLPFACANDEASRNGIFWGWNEFDSTVYGQLTGNINPGGTTMNLYRMDGSGSNVPYNQLGNDKTLKGVCCYQTA